MINLMNRIWNGLILLLALELALVYPAHIVIDHAGLFGHHHQHDDNHTHKDHPEDDVCLFCVNMGGMEYSEALLIRPAIRESSGFTAFNESIQTGTVHFIMARAPPFAPLPNG